MFIKFGDKTKTKAVKEGANPDEDRDNDDVYLDEEDSDNRRIPILKSYKKLTQKNGVTNKK